MSIDHSDRLTVEQRQRIRQAQQYVREHAAEIDAAEQAAKVVEDDALEVDAAARVGDPAGDTLRTAPPVSVRTGALAAARAAIAEKSAASLSPTVSAIREAGAASRLGMRSADMVKPLDLKKLGFVQPPVFPTVTTANWGFKPPALKVDLPNPLLDALKMPPLPDLTSALPAVDLTSALPTVDLTLLVPTLPSVMPDQWMNTDFRFDKIVMPGILDQVRGFDTSTFATVLDALKAVSRWESVLPRIDLSAFARVQQISEAMTGLANQVTGLVNHVAPVLRVVEDMRGMIGSLLNGWETLAGVGHRLARSGLYAALKTREAALHGDQEAVTWFARRWLGIKRITVEVLDAVIGALLDWNVEGDSEAIKKIRSLYKRHRKGSRLIGEIKQCGSKIESLNRPVGQRGGGEVELGLLVPGQDVVCTGNEFTDPRLVELFGKLDPVERQIVEARFLTADKGITWAAAAEDCGYSAAMGESVRRKVRRLSGRIAPEAS